MDSYKKNHPEILAKKQAIFVEKDNGTQVDYFLFDTCEVHMNRIPPGSIQDWHAHEKIDELVIVNSGRLFLEWLEAGYHHKEVSAGEIIRMNNSVHRLSNLSELEATCTIFRYVVPNENQATIIKNDKKVFSDEEIEILKSNY
jgi:quercetin dioxygenase-like cupin family protein